MKSKTVHREEVRVDEWVDEDFYPELESNPLYVYTSLANKSDSGLAVKRQTLEMNDMIDL